MRGLVEFGGWDGTVLLMGCRLAPGGVGLWVVLMLVGIGMLLVVAVVGVMRMGIVSVIFSVTVLSVTIVMII